MAANAVPFRSTIFYTTAGTPAALGTVFTVGANGIQSTTNALGLQSLLASTMTASTVSFSTMTASTILTAGSTINLARNVNVPNRFVEVGCDQANSMYLDFHSSDAALPDYSTRIISQGGATTGTGALNMYASTIGLVATNGVGIGITNPTATLHVNSNLIIANDIGSVNHFINSSATTTDGGVRCYTIRNDTYGGVRFMSANGGFSSYDGLGLGIDGAHYCNAIANNGAPTTGDIGSWSALGFTLFCNTTLPSGNQGAYGIGSNGTNTNFVVSLRPGVAWMNVQVWAATHYNYVNGVMAAYLVSGGWVNVSDAREKEDINYLKTSRSLERIMQCKPKYYKRKYYDTDKDGNATTPAPQSVKDEIHIGLLAQDVLQSNPHCVSGWKNDNIKDGDGSRYGINYGDFTVHLIGAVQEIVKQSTSQASLVQEQQKQIDDLKQENDSLKKQLFDLQKTIEDRFNTIAVILQELQKS